jgi:hypothetical protein
LEEGIGVDGLAEKYDCWCGLRVVEDYGLRSVRWEGAVAFGCSDSAADIHFDVFGFVGRMELQYLEIRETRFEFHIRLTVRTTRHYLI